MSRLFKMVPYLVLMFVVMILSLNAGAGNSVNGLTAKKTRFERVGGSYVVESIDPLANGGFVVMFKSEPQTGKFDVLRLESDHVHVAIKVGDKIRLSAEIKSFDDNVAEVSQVLLFLPAMEGHVPVWLLSRGTDNSELRGAPYLKMHAPQSDFIVL